MCTLVCKALLCSFVVPPTLLQDYERGSDRCLAGKELREVIMGIGREDADIYEIDKSIIQLLTTVLRKKT